MWLRQTTCTVEARGCGYVKLHVLLRREGKPYGYVVSKGMAPSAQRGGEVGALQAVTSVWGAEPQKSIINIAVVIKILLVWISG